MERLWLWDEVEQIIHRHLEPERQPLLPKLQRTRQDDLLTQLYTALHRLANPNRQDSTALDHGCFPDIPMPIQSFELLMSAAYRISHVLRPRRALRFLDIGCGGGTKVLAATRFFEQTDGLEYDQTYADSARRTIQIIGKPNSSIFHADALTFDSYSDYDVIYCYRPLRTDALLETLERRIIRQARPGTILIAPYTVLQSPRDNKIFCRPGIDCAKVEGPLFVTGIEQADADQVRLDAEATSTEILVRSTDRDLDTGYWAPILDAASFNAAG
jgi:protein-L-isoaspartate O-methyltransferase